MFRAFCWTIILCIATVCAAQIQQAGAKKAVTIKDMAFSPASVQIKAGDTVVWTNNDDRDHTVVGQKNAFKSENLRPGGTFSFTFTKAGTFSYGCSYHPRMAGTIVVGEK